MNKPLLTFLILLLFITSKAQTKNNDVSDTSEVHIKAQPDTVNLSPEFIAVEKEPSYYGGIKGFYNYLQKNIKYLSESAKKRLEGKVFISFMVEKDGSLSEISVLRGVSPDIDAEAIRVVSKSPKWLPAIQNGKVVRARYSIAIIFQLPPVELSKAKKKQMEDSLRQIPFEQRIFTKVQNMPEFPGGKEGFRKYFLDNLKYPDKAKEDNVNGNVLINFVIERDGSISNIKIARNLTTETDAEALRVMNNCPKWVAGTQNGKPARVAYSLLIPFPIKNQ